MKRAYYLFLPQSPAASSFYSDDTAPTTGRRYGIRARGSFVHVPGRKPRLVPASSHMPGGSSGATGQSSAGRKGGAARPHMTSPLARYAGRFPPPPGEGCIAAEGPRPAPARCATSRRTCGPSEGGTRGQRKLARWMRSNHRHLGGQVAAWPPGVLFATGLLWEPRLFSDGSTRCRGRRLTEFPCWGESGRHYSLPLPRPLRGIGGHSRLRPWLPMQPRGAETLALVTA